MKILDFFKIILKGIGQVMLQNNAITGLFFLIGIFYNSWLMGLGALLGVFTSTITASILGYKKEDIHDGLYGFNGTLVGIALIFFFEVNVFLLCLIILGSILSSIIMNFMQKKKLYPYTFPFVLTTWLSIFLIKYFYLVQQKASEIVQASGLNIISASTMGLGQVMFQENIITGIIFLLAILINSRISAFYAIVGTFLGMLLAYFSSLQVNMINIGIFGFNAVLCGIAFSGKKKMDLVYAIMSIAVSVFIIYLFMNFGLTALTAPFVFATWVTLAIRMLINNKK